MEIVDLRYKAKRMADFYGVRESLSDNIIELALEFASENCKEQITECTNSAEQSTGMGNIQDCMCKDVKSTKNVIDRKIEQEKKLKKT